MSKAGGIRQAAVKLAMAGGIEYGLQVAMPVILVRYLDVRSFGEYRLLWLVALTAFSIAPCFIPQSMFYFLPRATTPRGRAVLLGNTLLYMVAAGGVAALATSGWNPWMPDATRQLFDTTRGWSAVFIGLWIVAGLFDTLPTADGNARWQARSMVAMAILRTVLLGTAAWLSGDVNVVIIAMVGFVCLKLSAMATYLWTRPQRPGFALEAAALRRQLAYAAPFAFGNALFLMRMQADQWVVATTMSTTLYAMFSIATVLQPVSTLIRTPVFNAIMAPLNAAFASGDLGKARQLLSKANGAAAFLLIPVAGGLFSVAPDLVALVYTSKYGATAPVMQVYIVGMMVAAFSVSQALPALNKGRFATLNNAVCLPLSVAISVAGAHYWGMIGAAFGSVSALVVSELWSARVIAATLQSSVVQLLALRMLWPSCVATAAAMGGVAVVAWSAQFSPLGNLALKGGVYAAVGMMVLWLCGGKRSLMEILGRR